MKLNKNLARFRNYIINLIVPALILGFMTGTLTSIFVLLYKLCAKYVTEFSEIAYTFLREHLYYIPLILLAFIGLSYLLAYIYKSTPNLKGGGIPTSVGILRGIITFKWLRNLIGIFVLSLTTFLIGVPLGNEGPSVQMGTAIGRGSVFTFAKKHKAWDRYSMTGGACAGFSVATGAPISGIIFAIEEAHQRISPTIVIVASSSVMFANIASKILCPVFGVSEKMFDIPTLPTLDVWEYWIPLALALVIGLFSVLFLHYYKLIDKLLIKKLKAIPHQFKILAILVITLALGLISFSFISTGHDLVLDLFENKGTVVMLLIILALRTTVTLGASSAGITGGTFVPILTLGAVIASIIGKALIACGLSSELYTIILVLGITASIAGSMKMPITAIIFSLEALSCYDNLIPVIIVAFFSYLVTEIFETKSINDVVMESRIDSENEGKNQKVIDTYVTVQKGAFAIGKQIRDIFWPSNLFVLSVKHSKADDAQVDEHGGKAIREGDVLHVRCSTLDESVMKEELIAIVGAQEIVASVVDKV
ncbi:MAG: chloride channel protein [Clostridia bacterium]|nr:chloride channel protein [Clostridia bacterium]